MLDDLNTHHLAMTARRRSAADVCDLERTVIDASAGDQRAWNALVDRFRGRVQRVARSYGLSAHEVDDVVQETWIRLFRHIGSVRDPQALGAWLATTASRESLRLLRSGRREEPTDGELGSDAAALGDLDDELVRAERRVALAGALEALPERHRALMESLLAEPERSYGEISAQLGIPIGSIGPIRSRCVTRLQRRLVAT